MIKANYRLSKLGVKSSVLLMLLLASFVLVESRFSPIQPVQASPATIQYNGPTKYSTTYTTFEAAHLAPAGQDWSNTTWAAFNWENAAVGSYYDLNWFASAWADGWPAPGYLNTIASVDFKMRYNAQNAAGGGTLKIYILLGASNTVLVADTGTPATAPNAYPQGNTITWPNVARPGLGSWTWEDVRKVTLRVETTKRSASSTSKFVLYEGWINVNWVKPTTTPTVYIEPPSLVDTAATRQSTTIRPNGNGASLQWKGYPVLTNHYQEWDEVGANDGDATYVWTTSNLQDETSVLQDVTPPSWNIAVVRVTAYARSNVTTDEAIVPMLVIGGTKYLGTINSVTTTYQKYTSDWGKNPATGKYWTWAEINALEAGLRSYQIGAVWTPNMEIRATQLYVEVIGPRVEVGVFLKEYVEDLYSFSFSLTFNPDVLQGAWVEQYRWSESKGVPIEIGPVIYNNTVKSTQPLRGMGWNNTVGKLYATGSAITGVVPPPPQGAGIFCPDVAGRIATLVFEVVGKGETNLVLGSDTIVYYDDAGTPTKIASLGLQNGYFRNVAPASIPTASFTKAPVGTPVPLEGYNTTFTDTSTPAAGRTIVTRKWYFWREFAESLDQLVVSPLVSYDKNYTTRGTWNVTLTVIDDSGVSGTKQGYIAIKAHDIFFAAIYTNATTAIYPGVPALKIGQTLKINATAWNQGNYSETFSVSTFWGAFDSGIGQMIYGLIGTQAGVVLNAGQKLNVTFNWNTAGRILTHPDMYEIHANASRVQYEYDIEWSTGKLAPNEFVGQGHRVRHHDVAITEITTNTTAVKIGDTVRVSVTMQNEGDYVESGLTVTAYYGNTVIGTFPIFQTYNWTYSTQVLFNQNYTRTLDFNWVTTGLPYGDYTIKATISTVPSESETADNTLIMAGQIYLKIPGDINGDRTVNGVDFGIFAPCYGSSFGQPKYNRECDFNNSGTIDGVDFGIFAPNYGKSLPPI